MVAPVVAGAMIGAGASLLGGALGGRSARRQQRREAAAQKEFAQHGIQWRVEDAKAAGVHPLFALGANTPTYSPTSIVGGGVGEGLAQAGQAIGNAVARSETPQQNAVAELNLRMLRANVMRSEQEAWGAFLDNEARSLRPLTNAQPGGGVDPRFIYGEGGSAGGVGQVQVKPSEVISSSPGDPSMEAGMGTFWKSHRVTPDGRVVALPSSELSELLESMSESPFAGAMVLKKNLQRDPEFLIKNRDWIPFAEELNMAKRAMDNLSRWGNSFYDWYTDPDTYRLTPSFRSRSAPWKNRSGRWSYPPR